MAVATYASPAQRIGKIKGQILKHAIFVETVEMSGEIYKQPVKSGDTVIFRQVIPFGATSGAPNVFSTTAAAHLIQEGSTPDADTLSVLDTSVIVQKYGALYSYTERQKSLGEDDIPAWMEEQLGERLGLVRELVYVGGLQGCTNRFFSGGTTRATVANTITDNLVQRVNRSLRSAHALYTRGVLAPSGNYGTRSIQKSFLAFANTDAQADIERVPGYTKISDYGQMKPAHDLEIGSAGSMRFILSPEMPKFIDSGASYTNTGFVSTSSSLMDVYQMFCIAQNAWGHTAFRGLDAFKYNHIPVDKVDKTDPTGERGYVSATFYDAGVVTNHGWMAVVEHAITALTN